MRTFGAIQETTPAFEKVWRITIDEEQTALRFVRVLLTLDVLEGLTQQLTEQCIEWYGPMTDQETIAFGTLIGQCCKLPED